MKIKTFSDQSGFTLVELMASLFISMLVFGSVFFTLIAAHNIFRTTDLYSQLNQDAMQTLRSISREVGQTSPNTTPSYLNISTDAENNSVIRFQIPVDWDNDGDADTGGLNPQAEWGAYDQAGQTSNGCLGCWARYSVTDTQLIREVLDSSLVVLPDAEPKIIANNVESFVVLQSADNLTMTLTVLKADETGNKGVSAREFQQTFETVTLLRNAVS